MDIKNSLKKNKQIYRFIKRMKWLLFVYIPFVKYSLMFHIKKILRISRINRHSPFEKLKKIKNKHQGERCFIIATGPSLTIGDLEKLNNEITISMNSICLAFDETDWRPTYYGIQDEGVYKRMEEYIEALGTEGK